jgi:hypothetical protein
MTICKDFPGVENEIANISRGRANPVLNTNLPTYFSRQFSKISQSQLIPPYLPLP